MCTALRPHWTWLPDFGDASGLDTGPSRRIVTIPPFDLPADVDLRRERRALLFFDYVESGEALEADEEAAVRIGCAFVKRVREQLLGEGGHFVKSHGDGALLEFEHPRQALTCAWALLKLTDEMRSGSPEVDRLPLRLRIGLHLAQVLADELDLYGAGVHLAHRLMGLADVQGVVASVDFVEAIVVGLDADVEDLGDCYVKHLKRPVRALRLLPTGSAPTFLLTSGTGAGRHGAFTGAPPPRRVAILSLDCDSCLKPLGSLAADEIALLVSPHDNLHVISRMSTRRVTATASHELLQHIGAELVVSGVCASFGTKLIISLELTHVPSMTQLWSGKPIQTSADTLVADPAQVLAESCAEIIKAIEVFESKNAATFPLASLDSYALKIGGLRLMHRLSRHDFDRAYELFEALVARHPRHPDGYAWLAKWHILQVHQGWSSDPALSIDRARDMARRAQRLDKDCACPVARIVAGMVSTFSDRRLDQAESIYAGVLDQHPNEALAHLFKGVVHAFRGEGEQAVSHTRRALALSPIDPMGYYFDSLSASAEAAAGNFGEAIRLGQRSLQANAQHASTLRILAIAYAKQDRLADAREMVTRLLDLEPQFSVRKFLERSPSADYPIGRAFAQALAYAGVPH
jgi:class 3 adenylate cyclase/tetratricopeptide (TPR) repeat protein